MTEIRKVKTEDVLDERTGRYKFSVLDAAAELHGSSCGSSDALTRAEMHEMAGWLRNRVEKDWHESLPRYAEYDAAVRVVALAACHEAERLLAEIEDSNE